MIVIGVLACQADANERRWSFQSSGKRVSAIRRETVRSGTCRPDSIDAAHRAARKTTIVVAVPNHHPSLMPLRCDKSLASLTLGIERVELLFQSFLAGFARIDRAAQSELSFGLPLNHQRTPAWAVRSSARRSAVPTNERR